MKKLIAALLILVMLFSFAACKSSTEEEEAMSGELVEDNSDTTPDDNSSNNNDNNNNNNDNTNQTPGNSTQQPDNSNNNDSNKEENNTPPLSTDGKYTVTFDYGFDNKVESEKTDGKVTEVKPERAGYEFAGWFDGETKFDFSKDIASDTKLCAKWNIITYTITYKTEGGTVPAGNPTTYTVDSEFKLMPAEKPYALFTTWNVDAGDGKFLAIDSISKGMTGDLTLVAVWGQDVIVLGKYEQDGNKDNGAEPIVWEKIKEENGKTLYLSRYILDSIPYNSPKASVSWSTCTLRTWLNGTFYNSAFTAEEKSVVIYGDIFTARNKSTGIGSDMTTKDRVFLLSLEEADSLQNYALKKGTATAHAKAQGCLVNSKDIGDWWFRTAGCYDNYAAFMQQNGGSRDNGYSVDLKTIGVRPAIWVDTSKIG
ncbi:MAG: InlB B-repeat-containing protein [Clostridia bacterium]|nr:InlB B-repeat-containing protein [Clostridia bacterium]